MGCFWGSKFIAVTSDNLLDARVEQVDLKPTAYSDPEQEHESVYARLAMNLKISKDLISLKMQLLK